jgi:hypothetical protein
LIDDLAQDPRAKTAFTARAGRILQRSKPTSDISPSPLGDLVKVHTDPLSDGTDPQSLGRQLYDSGSLRQPLRGALGAYQLLQFLFFSRTQHYLSTLLGHSKHPSTFLKKCHYYLRDITLVHASDAETQSLNNAVVRRVTGSSCPTWIDRTKGFGSVALKE